MVWERGGLGWGGLGGPEMDIEELERPETSLRSGGRSRGVGLWWHGLQGCV